MWPKGTKKCQFLKYGFVHYSTKFNGFLCKILRNKEKYKQILIGKLAWNGPNSETFHILGMYTEFLFCTQFWCIFFFELIVFGICESISTKYFFSLTVSEIISTKRIQKVSNSKIFSREPMKFLPALFKQIIFSRQTEFYNVTLHNYDLYNRLWYENWIYWYFF